MRSALQRLRSVGLALYVCWLLAVVALLAGRYTPVPRIEAAHTITVAGAVVLTLIGAAQLARDGYRRVTT